MRAHNAERELSELIDPLLISKLHLKRKTAWSNASLVGCRISCLVDYKEWHEGIVTQFHRGGGRHLVEFRFVNEKRWLVMRKIAFYIVERPNKAQNRAQALQEEGSPVSTARDAGGEGAESEFKEDEVDSRQRNKTEVDDANGRLTAAISISNGVLCRTRGCFARTSLQTLRSRRVCCSRSTGTICRKQDT